MAPRLPNVLLEHVQITFRNFEGKVDPIYNPRGNREFSVLLDEETAAAMRADGWNVKQMKIRDEGDEPQAYLPVTVSYKMKPPAIGMVTSGHPEGVMLEEQDLKSLDWVDLIEANLLVTPSYWEMGGNSGIKAYLKTGFFHIEEDYLLMKYAALALPASETRAIESGRWDYIEGEVVEPHELEG